MGSPIYPYTYIYPIEFFHRSRPNDDRGEEERMTWEDEEWSIERSREGQRRRSSEREVRSGESQGRRSGEGEERLRQYGERRSREDVVQIR